MGVYIKGLTIDEFSEYGDYCKTLIGTGQAEEVPPHGRLIDADALKPYMLNAHYKHRLVYDANEVANAPTIITAEEEGENFCADCHWYESEQQYCFRKGCHSYDESSCELWEPMPADEPIPAPGGKTDPITYDLLYEEGGYSGNGI